MKNLVYILILCLPLSTLAQKSDTVPFNGASKVVISNNQSLADNYKLIGQLFIDAGYFINKRDPEYCVVESEPIFVRAPGYILYSQTIYAIAKKNSITLLTKGRYSNGGEFTPAAKTVTALDFLTWQKKGDVEPLCFKNMISIAEKIPNSTITYSE